MQQIKRKNFNFKDSSLGISVFLTKKRLYFSCPNGDGIFEISMTALEFDTNAEYNSLSEHFATFDPQNDGWWKG